MNVKNKNYQDKKPSEANQLSTAEQAMVDMNPSLDKTIEETNSVKPDISSKKDTSNKKGKEKEEKRDVIVNSQMSFTDSSNKSNQETDTKKDTQTPTEEPQPQPQKQINDAKVDYMKTQTNSQNSNPVFIHTKFGTKTQPVQFTIIATGQNGKTSISGGKLRLIYGRIYFIPIDANSTVSSDAYANMKIFSDMADKIDVRYINNSYAAIIPLQNNITITDGARICVLW